MCVLKSHALRLRSITTSARNFRNSRNCPNRLPNCHPSTHYFGDQFGDSLWPLMVS